MCSNFQPIKNNHASWVKEQFDCDLPQTQWRAESYPTYAAPFVYLVDGKPKCELAQFGLVPHWATDKQKFGLKTYNARSETVAEKPSYRNARKQRRFGLVLMERKALMEELKKYSPEHPFLDETPILDNSMAKTHALSQRPDDFDYKRAVTGLMGERNNMTDSQDAVNMLVVEVDGVTTKGDMAMVEAGVAVVADGKDNNPTEMTDAITDKSQEIFAKYNPDLEPSAYRTQALIPPPSTTQKALGAFVKLGNMFSGR